MSSRLTVLAGAGAGVAAAAFVGTLAGAGCEIPGGRAGGEEPDGRGPVAGSMVRGASACRAGTGTVDPEGRTGPTEPAAAAGVMRGLGGATGLGLEVAD